MDALLALYTYKFPRYRCYYPIYITIVWYTAGGLAIMKPARSDTRVYLAVSRKKNVQTSLGGCQYIDV